TDVLSIDIRIGHNDDFIISQILDVLIFAVADIDTDGGDEAAYFVVFQQVLQASLLDVKRLAAQRQDGLKLAITAGLGGATGRIALYQEQFRSVGIALGAVEQLPR